jgi:hypothetical protein
MIGPDTVIALEEHYYDAELAALPGFLASAPMRAQLLNFESKGIEAMDRAGIDIQVISHNAPSGQALDAAQGDLMRRVNDRRPHSLRQAPSPSCRASPCMVTEAPTSSPGHILSACQHFRAAASSPYRSNTSCPRES